MKKLFFVGALALSVFSFANTSEVKNEVKKEMVKEVKELSKEQKTALAFFAKWWSVSFVNACGQKTTVLYQTDFEQGTQGFIRDLAFAVNTGYEDCLSSNTSASTSFD